MGQNIGDCPVCGHKVNLYKKDPEARSSLYFIRCSNEDCFFTTLYDDEITLLKWWAGRNVNKQLMKKE